MSQGGHSEPLLLLALFYQSTPSCLKVGGVQTSSDLVRTFGSGLGDCWDGGLGLGLGLDNKPKKIQNMLKAFYLNSNFFVRWCQDLICMCDFLLMMALNNSFTFHIVIAWQGRLEITLTD